MLLPLPALAQEDGRARELYDNGVTLYDEGRYEDAIAAWQEAYNLSQRPLLLFNIANAHERLGHVAEALDALNRYRAFAPEEERETLERRIRNLDRRLDEQREKEKAEAAIAVQQLQTKPRDEAPRRVSVPVPPIVLLAAGIGAAGAGAALDGAALSTRGQAKAQCAPAGEGWLCQDGAASLLARDRTLSGVGDALLIAGGATAGVGLILLGVQTRKTAALRGPAFAVVPMGAGAQLVGIWP